MTGRGGRGLAAALLGLAALVLLPACAEDESVSQRDRRLLAADVAALAPQRPGSVDLYVVGFAGDSTEDVFRNEVAYLDTLASNRFGARGVVTLVNHFDSLTSAPRPLATLENLRIALAGVGKAHGNRRPGAAAAIAVVIKGQLVAAGARHWKGVRPLPDAFRAVVFITLQGRFTAGHEELDVGPRRRIADDHGGGLPRPQPIGSEPHLRPGLLLLPAVTHDQELAGNRQQPIEYAGSGKEQENDQQFTGIGKAHGKQRAVTSACDCQRAEG